MDPEVTQEGTNETRAEAIMQESVKETREGTNMQEGVKETFDETIVYGFDDRSFDDKQFNLLDEMKQLVSSTPIKTEVITVKKDESFVCISNSPESIILEENAIPEIRQPSLSTQIKTELDTDKTFVCISSSPESMVLEENVTPGVSRLIARDQDQPVYIKISSESETDCEMPKVSLKRKHWELEERSCTYLDDDLGDDQFYNNNPNLPIFRSPASGLESTDIFKMCLGEVDQKFVCKTKPVSVRKNAVFVIDLDVVPLKSLFSDDNGAWVSSTPSQFFKVLLDDGKVARVSLSSKLESTHQLKRQYGTHKNTLEANGCKFQRVISSVIPTSRGIPCKFAVVQYLLKNCTPDDIVLKPHGNSTGLRKYFKTDTDVMTNLEKNTDVKPKKLFSQMMKQAGGPLQSKSASSEPRNMQQIYNVNRKVKHESSREGYKTDLGHLITQIKQNEFVRDLSITGDSIQYLLYTNEQINDLNLFCTNESRFSVFSVDATYNIGNFFVTNTCFQNYRLLHADGKYRGRYPHALGPSFIHTDMETNSYVRFFSSLIRSNPDLKNIKAIGTDGEEALMNACVICFPDALQLICTDHKKGNIEAKLKEYRVSEAAKNHVIYDIFGRNIGTKYESGLIDSSTKSDFEKRCLELKSTWDHLIPGFHSWFLRYQADLFKRHLIAAISSKAYIKGKFSNNRIKSIHKKLKDWLESKEKHSMPSVNLKIEDAVKCERDDFDMAVYNHGSYDLSPEFSYLKKERHEWSSMTETERSNAIGLYRKSKPKTKKAESNIRRNTCIDTESISTVQYTSTQEKEPTFSFGNITLPGVDKAYLDELCEKAQRITDIDNSVIKAPGFDGCYVRHSAENIKYKPHLVTISGGQKVVCSDCPVYQSMKICPHALVGALHFGVVEKYILWRQKQKGFEKSVSDLLFSCAKGGKKKVVKPRRGGRNPVLPVADEDQSESDIIERPPLIPNQDEIESVLDDIDNFQKKEHKFEIIYLFQTKATVCYGCRAKFMRDKNSHKLIIRKFCEREFRQSGEIKKKWQYAYFHLKKECVEIKFPNHELTDEVIAPDTKAIMPEKVIAKLKDSGIE